MSKIEIVACVEFANCINANSEISSISAVIFVLSDSGLVLDHGGRVLSVSRVPTLLDHGCGDHGPGRRSLGGGVILNAVHVAAPFLSRSNGSNGGEGNYEVLHRLFSFIVIKFEATVSLNLTYNEKPSVVKPLNYTN